jgi:hypothetical protein
LNDFSTNDMCPLCGGRWNGDALAGVWALLWDTSRSATLSGNGFRSALYL